LERIPLVRRAILADRPVISSLGWTAAAVVIPAALRWIVDQGESGIPFVTFFPAVLLASVLLGWRYGAITAAISGAVANHLLRPEPTYFDAGANEVMLIVLFTFACGIIVAAGETLRRLVREQEGARLRERDLKRELLHRVKNMFAIVQSLASITARNVEPEEFVRKFGDRLSALDKANSLFGSADVEQRGIEALMRTAVEPFRAGKNISVSGPDFQLPKDAIVPLALALHELCTNALKYGALSVPEGRVTIDWELVGDGRNDLLIQWKETDGPKVHPPSKLGLGSLLLRPRHSLKDVKMEFQATGLECVIIVENPD
jgi:two-component sensor histidine kinase